MWKQSLLSVFCLLNLYSVVVYGQSTGFINNRIWLVKANLSSNSPRQDVGIYSNGNTVDVSNLNRNASYTGPLGLVIPVTGTLKYMNMTFLGKTYYDLGRNFFALGVDNGNNYTIIPELRINGLYSIKVDAVSTNDYVNTTYISFTIVGGSSAVAPVAPPLGSPSSKPSARPSSKPIASPVSMPVPITIIPPPSMAQPSVSVPVPITILPPPTSAQPSVLPSSSPVFAPTNATIRINCGSTSDWIDPLGNVWKADSFFSPGAKINNNCPKSIGNTELDTLFCTDRCWNTVPSGQYNIPVLPGSYNVTVMFAETWFWQSGLRVFNVSLQDVNVANLDVYQVAGQNNAYSLSYPVTVLPPLIGTLGNVKITLTNIVEFCVISAIQIAPLSTAPVAPVPIPVPVPLPVPVPVPVIPITPITPPPIVPVPPGTCDVPKVSLLRFNKSSHNR
jgi:Malectin domain